MKRINFISALLNFFFITSLIALPTISNAQLSQTIKGRVIDQQNKVGLPGANVVIEGSDLGSATDTEGSFRITGVPIGRYNIKVMYMGYKTQIIPEILVGSAKEVVLTIEMDEDIIEGESISVTPKIDKSKPASSSATVSARSFSVEETRRYAGGMDDPARLASSFAGVTYGNA